MTKYKIEIKWAFIFIASQLLWILLEKWTGLHDEYIHLHPSISMLFGLIAIFIYILALIDKRKYFYDGRMTYKKGFVSGLIITLIVTAFTPLTQWITSEVISPDYFTNIIQYSVETEKYDTVEEAEAYFNLKNYMLKNTFFALVMGVVTTTFVALFTRKK